MNRTNITNDSYAENNIQNVNRSTDHRGEEHCCAIHFPTGDSHAVKHRAFFAR